jgi:hypothetical protein
MHAETDLESISAFTECISRKYAGEMEAGEVYEFVLYPGDMVRSDIIPAKEFLEKWRLHIGGKPEVNAESLKAGKWLGIVQGSAVLLIYLSERDPELPSLLQI